MEKPIDMMMKKNLLEQEVKNKLMKQTDPSEEKNPFKREDVV